MYGAIVVCNVRHNVLLMNMRLVKNGQFLVDPIEFQQVVITQKVSQKTQTMPITGAMKVSYICELWACIRRYRT